MPIIQTPPAMLSYPALLVPRKNKFRPEDAPTYGCTLVFPVGADLKELSAAAREALDAKFGKDEVTKMLKASPPKLRLPFREDAEKYDPEKYKFYIQISSKDKPGLVDRYAGADGKPAPLDTSKLYPGCFVKAVLSVYAYENSGNRGVNFGLQHIQWWADGTRLDNRIEAADAFNAETRPEADLTSLTEASTKAEPGAALNDLLAG
ncbi:MAG: DUF2815 family protein [Pseudomonadota bacterium]|nr:DUF2815 family protein [Pseudomonadota bacterium]